MNKFSEQPQITIDKGVGVEVERTPVENVIITVAADAFVRWWTKDGQPFDMNEIMKDLGINAAWFFFLEDKIVMKIPFLSEEMSKRVIGVVGKSGVEFVYDNYVAKKSKKEFMTYVRKHGFANLALMGYDMFKRAQQKGMPSKDLFVS